MSQNVQDHGKAEGWHLSKSVPLALLLGLFIQTAGVIWWASGVNSTLQSVTRQFQDSQLVAARENSDQWNQIRANNIAAQTATERSRISEALLNRMESDIKDIKESVRELVERKGP